MIQLRNPDDVRIIQPAFVSFEIPIFCIFEARGVAVQKADVRAVIVEIGMDVVLLGYSGLLAIVEQPHDAHRLADGAQLNLVRCASAIDVLIQTIMKKVRAIASAGISGTDPD